MRCVCLENGEVSYDQGIILDEQTKFYKGLYAADCDKVFNLKRCEGDPMLTPHQKLCCDVPLSIDEIFDAVMTLKNNKVGGPDGFSAEYYKTFFHELKFELLNIYEYAFENRILPASLRRGLISLLPKKNKDVRFVKNMRLLTLLNVDYKILAKAMDNRLRDVLPSVIHEDQTGFMPGRSISVNIRKSLDVMEYCKAGKFPAVIMSVDMEKCFDRIEHDAIYGTLRLMNFGDNFIRWVSLFYTSFQVCTQNYGIRSEWFSKSRSINQGCNISPSIYLLVGEMLALRIRQNKEIRGIKIGDTQNLLSQFADDMDLYLPYDRTVINAVINTLTYIENNTGLKVSYDKTTMYRIGSLANTNSKLYTVKKLKWSNEAVNTLGFILYANDVEKNLEEVCCKMRTVCRLWYYRHLTLMGKIMIVNTMMGSLFGYRMQFIPNLSEHMINMVDHEIEEFIWKGK